ncbi:MAG: hypothetical protein AAFY56_04520 [Pseudomonadota bacterium]
MSTKSAADHAAAAGNGLTEFWQSMLQAPNGQAGEQALASARQWLELQQRAIAVQQECHQELARFTTARFQDYSATLEAMRHCQNIWDLATTSNEFMARSIQAFAEEAQSLASLTAKNPSAEAPSRNQ